MNKTIRALHLYSLLLLISLLSACGGGIFGTGDGSDIQDVDSIEETGNGNPEEDSNDTDTDESPVTDTDDDNTGEVGGSESEEVVGEGENTPGSPAVTTTLSFSNNTPSGLSSIDNIVPALKLVNLTQYSLSASVELTDSSDPVSIEASPQSTSDFLSINIGESIITVTGEDTSDILARVEPLNASEDSLTTLIIAENDQTGSPVNTAFMATAIDTRAVSTSSSVAEMRVVYTVSSGSDSIPEITLTPVGNNPNGSTLVLYDSQIAQENLSSYQLVSAGSYAISTSDDSFSQQLITAEAGSVYTLVITGQSLIPVYIEVDSLP